MAPPRGKPKKPVDDGVVRIDAHRHDEALADIERRHAEDEAARLAAEEEEYLDEEESESEEDSENVEIEDTHSDVEVSAKVGQIDLSFPETTAEFSNSPQCYPPSYYTLTQKERLLLLHAENFRKQFVVNFPQRRPLVLAVPNECNVQKLVCTTIRPTQSMFTPLIGSLEGCTKFVADFVVYEPLPELYTIPKRLVSPSTVIRRRCGNSFEMATLLCGMLLCNGFTAYVVSGVARKNTILNDQRSTPYPYDIPDIEVDEKIPPKPVLGMKYKLRPFPDLESHLDEQMAEMQRQMEEEQQRQREEAQRVHKEALEQRAIDRYRYRRTHAWVVVIDNAPWGIKPINTYENEDGDMVQELPKARFIEPCTGFICEANCKQYILIDSIWNNVNYYVNMQKYVRIDELRWDLRNAQDWEHLLVGEPIQMRSHMTRSEEKLAGIEHSLLEEQHLDICSSWASKVHISIQDFDERFPKLQKAVYYKRTLHERYAPYTKRDGKSMQLTLFDDDDYQKPSVRYEIYDNRADFLVQMKYTYKTEQVEEFFEHGRRDSLRYMRYNTDPHKPKLLQFYHESRVDCLKRIKVHNDRIILEFKGRSNRCYQQEFQFKPKGQKLLKVIEKFSRNLEEDIPAERDVAERVFHIKTGLISLKYHYAKGAITASTRDFFKPPKADYGKELRWDPNYTRAYKSRQSDPDPTPLQLYRLLLEQLDAEERVKRDYDRICDDIASMLEEHKEEMRDPILKFSILDHSRNGAARAIRMQELEAEEKRQRDMLLKPVDFLAPYLVAFKKRALTVEQSWSLFNTCLYDLRVRQIGLLNDLQQQYEDLSAESSALKRFLNKFENHFQNYDYECLVKDAKTIEVYMHMVQKRVQKTREDLQERYDEVKESLLHDERLNLGIKKSSSDEE